MMDMMPAEALLLDHGTIRSGRLGLDKTHDFWADLSAAWVREIFADIEDGQKILPESVFNIHLQIKKTNNADLDYPIVVVGKILLNYQTHCIRCLEDMPVSVELPVAGYFISSAYKTAEEYQDQDVAYAEQQELDLYFMDNREVDLMQLIRETIFLNIDPFPLHDELCLGLCQQCGHNLNEGPCGH